MDSFCPHCTNNAQLYVDTFIDAYLEEWVSRDIQCPVHLLISKKMLIDEESSCLFQMPCTGVKGMCAHMKKGLDPEIHGHSQGLKWACYDIDIFLHNYGS